MGVGVNSKDDWPLNEKKCAGCNYLTVYVKYPKTEHWPGSTWYMCNRQYCEKVPSELINPWTNYTTVESRK